MAEFIAIPKERVAVLIGKDGETKAIVERRCKISLEIDRDGQVTILEPENKEERDPLLAYRARDVIRAIGRGFSPEKALSLVDRENNELSIIDLDDYARNGKAKMRLKSRIIGTGGKSRRVFEETLGIYMSVYGDTVGLIGPETAVEIARQGIEKLLSGSMHATVYKFIDKKRREAFDGEANEWWQKERA